MALLHSFAAQAGGAEAHVTRLRPLLVRGGYEVIVGDLRDSERTRETLTGFRPQIVHLHNVNGVAARVPHLLSLAGVPAVRTLHDHSLICPAGSLFAHGRPCVRCTTGAFHQAGFNGCVNVLASLGLAVAAARGRWPATAGIKRFVTSSADLAARVGRTGIRTPVDSIGTFVPDDRMASKPRDSGGLVLCAGRLVAGKGFDVMLTAARGLGAEVVIAGDGPLLASLAARVRDEALGHVTLAGQLAERDYAKYLGRAAIVVLPSEAAEVTPTVICEAFAAGIPVVASEVDSVRELVGDNQRGVLVPSGDAVALRTAISDLLNDDARRAAMGRAALDYARTQLSAERYLERLSAVYAEALADA